MNDIPLMTADQLRTAGRSPAVPFRVALADGRALLVRRLLRVLPGKRIVGEAEVDGQRVLAKLFIASASRRHWQQERDGIDALQQAKIATPDLVAALAINGGGHALLTNYLESADSLADLWAGVAAHPAGDAAALAVLTPALALLGQMHRCGLIQEDLHLGNFLRSDGRLFVIDGDAVRRIVPGALDSRSAASNLAILLAQLPAAWDAQQAPLLAAYADGACVLPDDFLRCEIARVRAWRLKDYLAKTVRDCTLFAVSQTASCFTAVVREASTALAPLLRDPDLALQQGAILKAGNTCTVAQAASGAGAVVIKRYNLKNIRHALTRLWRPSRAWHSWREGHRLRFLGIATPAPLALVEERIGPLRRRAWLVNEFCPGVDLSAHLRADALPPEAEAAAIIELFQSLSRLRISHGDLKATNLLWHAGRVQLIDLDAVMQHRTAAAHARAWRRDRLRLLRNWPQGSTLHRWLDEHLPPA